MITEALISDWLVGADRGLTGWLEGALKSPHWRISWERGIRSGGSDFRLAGRSGSRPDWLEGALSGSHNQLAEGEQGGGVQSGTVLC